eukprot:COSAG06_NODE_1175_length_10410_cov_7.148579_1_plen_64_part_00
MGRPSKDATPCALLNKSVQVLVTTDWKMKILSAFFRENQALFFGKRGTSLLGWMIVCRDTSKK